MTNEDTKAGFVPIGSDSADLLAAPKPCKVDRTVDEILAGLQEPGKRLVFIDDGGTHGKLLPKLMRDYSIYCAAVLRSDMYGEISAEMQSFLASLDDRLVEFHATEIINPKKESAWSIVAPDKRCEAIEFLTDVVADNINTIPFCYVTGEQYDLTMRSQIAALGMDAPRHKDALRAVFLGCLIAKYRNSDREVALVIDTASQRQDEIGFQVLPDAGIFYERSIIHCQSWRESGIQLADFVSYVMNRIHHVAQRAADGRTNRFDEVVALAYDKLKPKYVHLLDERRAGRPHGSL